MLILCFDALMRQSIRHAAMRDAELAIAYFRYAMPLMICARY